MIMSISLPFHRLGLFLFSGYTRNQYVDGMTISKGAAKLSFPDVVDASTRRMAPQIRIQDNELTQRSSSILGKTLRLHRIGSIQYLRRYQPNNKEPVVRVTL